MSLEEEAKKFVKKKRIPEPIAKKKQPVKRTLTPKDYFTGCALVGLLARSEGARYHRADIKREAQEWAEFMLEE